MSLSTLTLDNLNLYLNDYAEKTKELIKSNRKLENYKSEDYIVEEYYKCENIINDEKTNLKTKVKKIYNLIKPCWKYDPKLRILYYMFPNEKIDNNILVERLKYFLMEYKYGICLGSNHIAFNRLYKTIIDANDLNYQMAEIMRFLDWSWELDIYTGMGYLREKLNPIFEKVEKSKEDKLENYRKDIKKYIEKARKMSNYEPRSDLLDQLEEIKLPEKIDRKTYEDFNFNKSVKEWLNKLSSYLN